jgi:pyruvate/2-oxoglutarate dehydrogenase complex dihydrolipoamide acyltransferase (E2) component
MSELVRELGMPRLGIAMKEGGIVRWLKREGDEVTPDEVLVVIENDKVEIEVPSPWRGVVVELLAQEGDVVPVLQPIARIREA